MEIYCQRNYENANNFIICNHHLIKGLRVNRKYSILISKVQNKASSNIYFKNLFNDYNIVWAAIYMLSRLVTYNTFMQYFQRKISNNVLFLNKKLNTYGRKQSPLCSLCNLYDETC